MASGAAVEAAPTASDAAIEAEPWEQLWRIEGGDSERDSLLATLPRYARMRNDLVNCTIDHLVTEQFTLALTRHKMRSIYTECRSERCHANVEDGRCICRYKINSWELSTTSVVYQQGHHQYVGNAASPVTPKLTLEMKAFIQDQLLQQPDVRPYALFSAITAMVHNGQMRGPEPELEQVQNYVKEWRSNNPVDSYPQAVQFCEQRMYDMVGISADFPEASVVLCDTREGDHGLESNLGDGSESNPFRAGITSYKLLEAYVGVQQNPEQTSMLHIDTTFNVNKQRFPVMVVGMPDRSGHFFPVAYFCISYRRACDIVWCLRQLNRVLGETFGVRLAPEFVMMDGDKAQFNACHSALPDSVVLMCWYHVVKNVLTKAKAKGAGRTQTQQIFSDLYDLHFARADEYAALKAEVLARWDQLPVNSGAQRLARHIVKNWINHRMFGKWQAFHTPAGCPATNNPLEQYHKTLKINCNSASVTGKLGVTGFGTADFLGKAPSLFEHNGGPRSAPHDIQTIDISQLFASISPGRGIRVIALQRSSSPIATTCGRREGAPQIDQVCQYQEDDVAGDA